MVWKLENEISGFKIDGTVSMEFDGNIDYRLILTEQRTFQLLYPFGNSFKA